MCEVEVGQIWECHGKDHFGWRVQIKKPQKLQICYEVVFAHGRELKQHKSLSRKAFLLNYHPFRKGSLQRAA